MNETTHSVFDDSEWGKILMPTATALGSSKQNIKFLKKLVAVGVSNIVYLRADFPDESFAKRKLGSMELRVLQKTKGDENLPSNVLIELVKDGMAAIDKGYLRKMSLVIFEGDEDAEEGDMRKAYETYSFYFGKQDKDFSLTHASKQQGDVPMGEPGNSMPSELTEEKIVKSTKKLLRRLIAGTQELDVLPEVAYLTICLEYYDDVTPKDYQPKGYEHTDYTPWAKTGIEDDNASEPYYMGMGQIDMTHQKLALRLKSKARVLSEEDELHPASLEKQRSQDMNEGVEHAAAAVSGISLESANEETEGMEVETAQMSSKEQRKLKMKSKRKQLEEEIVEMEINTAKYKKYSTCKDVEKC